MSFEIFWMIVVVILLGSLHRFGMVLQISKPWVISPMHPYQSHYRHSGLRITVHKVGLLFLVDISCLSSVCSFQCRPGDKPLIDKKLLENYAEALAERERTRLGFVVLGGIKERSTPR